eukprot:626428-Pleurochrysis_carterae.AAC.1
MCASALGVGMGASRLWCARVRFGLLKNLGERLVIKADADALQKRHHLKASQRRRNTTSEKE